MVKYIHRELDLDNFGESLRRWIQTFYRNIDNASKWIKPSRGKDGTFLLLLTAELMSNKIRQSDSVKGVSLFGSEVKLSQFADDTTLICADTKSVENALQIPTDFGRLSGQDFLIGLVHRRYHTDLQEVPRWPSG